MPIEIRRVTTDELITAHSWTQASDSFRRWFKYHGGSQTLKEFLAEQTQANYHNFAVIKDEEFVALITYVEMTPNNLLVDTTHPPSSISKEELATAIYSIGYEFFNMGAKRCECWGASYNRHTRKLALLCGMRPDGMICYAGTHRGKLVKSVRYTVTREEHLAQRCVVNPEYAAS